MSSSALRLSSCQSRDWVVLLLRAAYCGADEGTGERDQGGYRRVPEARVPLQREGARQRLHRLDTGVLLLPARESCGVHLRQAWLGLCTAAQSLPTLLLFREGRAVDRVEGVMAEAPLAKRVRYYAGRMDKKFGRQWVRHGATPGSCTDASGENVK